MTDKGDDIVAVDLHRATEERQGRWPRTKNRVTDHDLTLISPKTGMILQILRGGPDRYGKSSFDEQTKIMQEIVDHMNKTMGLDQ